MNSLGAIITIILVVVWVVRGLASVMGSDKQEGSRSSSGGATELDQRIAQRRAERAQAAQRSQQQTRVQSQTPQRDLSQMTMAERIELARQRAREGAGASQQQAPDVEARRRLQARQEAARLEAQQARQREAREQAELQRQRVERERRIAQRRKAAEEQARAERLERAEHKRRAQRRSASRRSNSKAKAAAQAAPQPRTSRGGPIQTQIGGHGLGKIGQIVTHSTTQSDTKATLGPFDRKSLQKAFIMKEILDKPVALRGEQGDLLSQ